MKNLILLSLFVLFISAIEAQENKNYIEKAYLSTQLINSQTAEILPPKSWELKIQHRFGKIGADETLVTEFLGLDLPATMRFGFGFNLTKNLFFGIGRTNGYKTYDFESKYVIRRQTSDQKIPIAIAFYGNAALKTDKFPIIREGSFFEDGITPFKNKFKHRLSYVSELIFSSKLSNKFSLIMTPIFVYDNLTSIDKENMTAAISIGGRFKYSFNSSIIWEYARVLNNRGDNFVDPISLGVEFGAIGHVFQVFISSSSNILENRIYTRSSVADYTKGKFLLGFNLQRSFWIKK